MATDIDGNRSIAKDERTPVPLGPTKLDYTNHNVRAVLLNRSELDVFVVDEHFCSVGNVLITLASEIGYLQSSVLSY